MPEWLALRSRQRFVNQRKDVSEMRPYHPWLERVDASGQPFVINDTSYCEAWLGGKWQLVRTADAYPARRNLVMRCPGCYGPIRLEKASAPGKKRMPDRMEHQPANPGCPLARRRSGAATRSPMPVPPPNAVATIAPADYIDEVTAAKIVGDVRGTVREVLMLARVGQGAFRDDLIRFWKRCSVTGCGPETVLVASHIVPWSKCATNSERIDPFNGLLLSPNLDKLFDRGFISFDDHGKITFSSQLSESDRVGLGVTRSMFLTKLPDQVRAYLRRHRDDGHFRP